MASERPLTVGHAMDRDDILRREANDDPTLTAEELEALGDFDRETTKAIAKAQAEVHTINGVPSRLYFDERTRTHGWRPVSRTRACTRPLRAARRRVTRATRRSTRRRTRTAARSPGRIAGRGDAEPSPPLALAIVAAFLRFIRGAR